MRKKPNYIARQLVKFSAVGIIPSILSVILCVDASYSTVVLTSIITNIIIFALTLRILYKFRMKHHDKKRYYKYNLSAMAIYGLVATGLAAIISLANCNEYSLLSKVYTYMFFNFKCLHYFSFDSITGFGIGRTHSAFYYTLFYMVVVYLFPIVVSKKKLLSSAVKTKNTEENQSRNDDVNENENENKD